MYVQHIIVIYTIILFYIVYFLQVLHQFYIYSLFFADDLVSISISSIRIIERGTNYQEIISSIRLFDNILSDNIGHDGAAVYIFGKWLLILKHLIYERKENKFDPFIYNTWKVFLQKKTDIIIDMELLGKNIKDLGFLGLIFGGRGLEQHGIFDFYVPNHDDMTNILAFYVPSHDDMTNILALNVLILFTNLTIMFINGVGEYPFSLYQLVLLLTHTKIKRVWIYSRKKNSWLYYLWRDKSSSLIEAYKNKGYAIDFDIHHEHGYGDHISIKLL